MYKPQDDLKEFIGRIEHQEYNYDYVFIILGKNGPTGKTYLTKVLRDNGYRAVEITECIFDNGAYEPRRIMNSVHVDELSKTITIILNKPLIKN